MVDFDMIYNIYIYDIDSHVWDIFKGTCLLMMNCFLGDKRHTPANTRTFWGGEPLDLAANGRVLVAIGPEQGWQRQEAGSKHGVDFALSPEAGLIYNSPWKF